MVSVLDLMILWLEVDSVEDLAAFAEKGGELILTPGLGIPE